jgi:hypothetical protein
MWFGKQSLITMAACFLAVASAQAVPFDTIRIGDRDGFGFSPTTGLLAANGGAADTDGDGILEQSEFLPNLGGSASAVDTNDNFDNRAVDEVNNVAPVGGNGFIDTGSEGSKWTDISLSQTFSGPDFPDPGGVSRPNEGDFTFRFFVATGDIVAGSTLFFNLVFGDYDVSPASVLLDFAAATDRTVALTTQGGGQDGLIQAATTTILFNEVFTATTGGWDGFLHVHFNAPNEPYTAFDYVELSLDEISFSNISAPGGLGLLGLGLAAFARRRRRRH